MAFLITVWSAFAGADLIVLDNGAIRVEVDPKVFSIGFVGVPGGKNFVEPLLASPEEREGDGWIDPGGLHTDVIPYTAKDPAARRGPAEVLEQRADYVALRGPPSERSGMRIKKEIQLVGREPRARYRVSALRVSGDSDGVGLRNTARVPEGVILRLMREDGDPRVLAGGDDAAPAVVKSRKFWLIPIPPTAPMDGVVLGAFVPRVVFANDSGTWTRTLVQMPEDEREVPTGCTFLCILDDGTATYGAALQGAVRRTPQGELVVLEEEWTVERRGQ